MRFFFPSMLPQRQMSLLQLLTFPRLSTNHKLLKIYGCVHITTHSSSMSSHCWCLKPCTHDVRHNPHPPCSCLRNVWCVLPHNWLPSNLITKATFMFKLNWDVYIWDKHYTSEEDSFMSWGLQVWGNQISNAYSVKTIPPLFWWVQQHTCQ